MILMYKECDGGGIGLYFDLVKLRFTYPIPKNYVIVHMHVASQSGGFKFVYVAGYIMSI